MKNWILLFSLISIAFFVSAEDSKRSAAKKVLESFEVKSYEERALDLVAALRSSGLDSPIEDQILVSRFAEMLSSKEFNHSMENIYMEYFSENELNEIAGILRNPSLQKFLASRLAIFTRSQEVLGHHIEAALSEHEQP